MNTIDRIRELIAAEGPVSGQQLAERLGMTRQGVNRHLQRLLSERRVAKTGSTRNARYRLVQEDEAGVVSPPHFRREYSTTGLAEDRVFEEVDLFLALKRGLSRGAYEIYRYALTEMVNNAVDHSHAERCTVTAFVDDYRASFLVSDRGIGIFRSIADRFELRDEAQAVIELSKGKRTTMPERHSGEGVFFTSKSADRLEIQSHRVRLVFDNEKSDLYVEKTRTHSGTTVSFELRRHSRRSLAKVFDHYASEDFAFRFQRTNVQIRLINTHYSSRSEAKRLTAGLEKFRLIELDFSGVSGIGQGFADELFRVFAGFHPEIRLEVQNANEIVARMIAHARGIDG